MGTALTGRTKGVERENAELAERVNLHPPPRREHTFR